MFKNKKRTALGMSQPTGRSSKLTNQSSDNGVHFQSVITAQQCRSSSKIALISDKVTKNNITKNINSFHSFENSVFQDNGLDALLKSSKSSFNNKFTNKNMNNGILSFENPFTVIHPTSFPKLMSPESPNLVKPKAKKPKLHVMMRRTKRKKKKKPQNNKPGTRSTSLPSTKSDASVTLTPRNDEDKFDKSIQKKADALDLSVSDHRLAFSSSLVQPSKILALSRLNVLNSAVSVDRPRQSSSLSDIARLDWSDKRGKKQHRLLYQKSKHKNVVDSDFAANLDSLVSDLNGMSICENPADNYVRVRPGEMPLPSIFKVIKIDVNKKVKDRILILEGHVQDKTKLLKTRKDSPLQNDVPLTVKPVSKGGRKKSYSDQSVDQREQLSICDSNDQCLPPKKRHRLVNIEAPMSVSPRASSTDESAPFKKDMKSLSGNQKEGTSRKSSGTDENKQGRLAQQYFSHELTVDTSREPDTCTPLLSPSSSRLSTRSSTLLPMSSPSPTGSSIFRSRHHSRNNLSLACAAHSVSSSLNDRLSCSDCRLLEQSRSPGRSTLRSLSIQVSDSSCSSEHPVSSSEPSPLTKQTSQLFRLVERSARKRRKSSSLFANDSDSSPPRLEKTTSLSPDAYLNSIMYSEPPVITCSPFRKYVSPRWQLLNKVSLELTESPTSLSSPEKKFCLDSLSENTFSDISPQRILNEPSPSEPTSRKLCNYRITSPQVSSKSVVLSPPSEYEPLPLEHCSNRKLVEEIQAATASDSDDDNFGTDECKNLSNDPMALRKHYESVGLFSDFYKNEKPRRNSENVMRSRDKLVYVREEHKFGLMPQPIHMGQFYMRQIQDFQLPYDIWRQRVQQQLPKKSERKIKFQNQGGINVPSDSKMNSDKLEMPLCNYSPQHSGDRGWGDDCLTRNVNDPHQTALFAIHKIEHGKELTNDHNFDSFSSQQECQCGSSNCRCVKSQHSNGTSKPQERVVDDCKDKRKPKLINKKMKDKVSDSVAVQPPAKPMTLRERCYARKHRTFLVRNVDKVRNHRTIAEDFTLTTKEEISDLYCNRMNAFSSDPMIAQVNGRVVKTRLAAYAKDNPELVRRHQLAQHFDKMLTELMSLKDEDGYNLVGPLMSLPSHKKEPQYYQVVREPIDLSIIKQRVKMGFYDHLSSFNSDMMLLFNNVELYCSSKSYMGQVIQKLRKVFDGVKVNLACQIDDLLGSNTTSKFTDSMLERPEKNSSRGFVKQDEDVIRCICGVTRDEGLMLQCEKCMIWQHCDCVRASGNEDHYLCDRCEPRYYDPEILLLPQPLDAQPDCVHYLTFVKDDVQFAVGDCVYVMRDCKRTSNGTPLRSSNTLKASVNPDMLDVFRLHQLWKNSKGGKFASGTPYLRPQETFHEPTRKFYHNELFRTPNFEIIPMELVAGKCVVMDPGTYIKGRPKGFREQDVYICEYRVDKTAHLFHKIPKIWYPINTSRFCFDWFDDKLAIKRTYLPHKVPDVYKRKSERSVGTVTPSRQETLKGTEKPDNKRVCGLAGMVKVDENIKNDIKLKAEVKVHVMKEGLQKKYKDSPKENDRTHRNMVINSKNKIKKQRLDKILTRLLNSLPGKQKVDLTYLLDEAKRVPKKVIK